MSDRLISADVLKSRVLQWQLQIGQDSTWCVLGLIDSTPTIEAEPTFEQIEEYCRKRCLVVVDVALFNEMKSRWSAEPYREFCKWTAEWVLKEDFEESAVAFAELVCRRLAKLGIIRKNSEYWTMDEVEK